MTSPLPEQTQVQTRIAQAKQEAADKLRSGPAITPMTAATRAKTEKQHPQSPHPSTVEHPAERGSIAADGSTAGLHRHTAAPLELPEIETEPQTAPEPAGTPAILSIARAGESAPLLARLGVTAGEGPVTFTDSKAVIVGDHNQLTVVEHFRPKQTTVSVAELEKTIEGSWTLSWAAKLHAGNRGSWLSYLLFTIFLPDCARVVAGESGIARLQAGSSCTIRDSQGVAVGDHLNARTHLEHHLKEFRAPAARLLRDKTFRNSFLAFQNGEQAADLQRAAGRALDRADDVSVPSTAPQPTVTLRGRGIHVRNAMGATLGIDSTLKSSVRLYFGQVRLTRR